MLQGNLTLSRRCIEAHISRKRRKFKYHHLACPVNSLWVLPIIITGPPKIPLRPRRSPCFNVEAISSSICFRIRHSQANVHKAIPACTLKLTLHVGRETDNIRTVYMSLLLIITVPSATSFALILSRRPLGAHTPPKSEREPARKNRAAWQDTLFELPASWPWRGQFKWRNIEFFLQRQEADTACSSDHCNSDSGYLGRVLL